MLPYGFKKLFLGPVLTNVVVQALETFYIVFPCDEINNPISPKVSLFGNGCSQDTIKNKAHVIEITPFSKTFLIEV